MQAFHTPPSRARRPTGRALASVFLAGALAFSTGALASSPGLFHQATSTHGFQATVAALKHAVSGQGLMTMGRIDQANILSMTGLHLRGAEAFLVGNPRLGKRLFEMDPAVGAVIPARMYVWVQGGKTHVGYFQPSTLLAAVDPALGRPAHKLDAKFLNILRQATR